MEPVSKPKGFKQSCLIFHQTKYQFSSLSAIQLLYLSNK